MIFLGEDEIAAGTVSVKRLATGEQTPVPKAELAEFIRSGLAEQAAQTVILEQ